MGLGTSDLGLPERAGDGLGVERGGEDEEPQLGAHFALDVTAEGEREVGVEAALMELVEEDHRGVGEHRVGEYAPREEPLGEDKDAGAGRLATFEADMVADGLADVLAEQVGHAPCGGAGGHAAGFQEENLLAGGDAVGEVAEKSQRQQRRLAGAGGGDNNAIPPFPQQAFKRGKDFCDREYGKSVGDHGQNIIEPYDTPARLSMSRCQKRSSNSPNLNC